MSTAETKVPSKSKNLKHIPLNLIHQSKIALRQAETKDEDWPGFVDSIVRNGVLTPILVREIRDSDGTLIYGLIDGTQRFEAAKLAGLEEIPAHIRQMNDAEILEASLIANVHKIETKPAQYSKQLREIFNQNPLLTLSDMATRLSRSPQWIKKRLELANLPDSITTLVDDGKIKLSNAYAMVDLAKQAPDEVVNFLDRAQTVEPIEFAAQVAKRVKEVREDKKQGRDPNKRNEFVPLPILRKPSEIKEEYQKHNHATAVLEAMKATSPLDGWKAAFAYIFRMDPLSEADGRKKFEEQQETLRKAQEERKAERAKKAQDAASKNTAEVTE